MVGIQFTPEMWQNIEKAVEQAKAEQAEAEQAEAETDGKQKGQFWKVLGDFFQVGQQPTIPANIVDTAPTETKGSSTTYAIAGGVTLAAIALLVYLIQRT